MGADVLRVPWWTPLALVAGLGVAISSAVFWVPSRAETFGELMESSFDLYRFALYEQLRWPLPENPDDERKAGELLSEYVWRDSPAGLAFASRLRSPPASSRAAYAGTSSLPQNLQAGMGTPIDA